MSCTATGIASVCSHKCRCERVERCDSTSPMVSMGPTYTSMSSSNSVRCRRVLRSLLNTGSTTHMNAVQMHTSTHALINARAAASVHASAMMRAAAKPAHGVIIRAASCSARDSLNCAGTFHVRTVNSTNTRKFKNNIPKMVHLMRASVTHASMSAFGDDASVAYATMHAMMVGSDAHASTMCRLYHFGCVPRHHTLHISNRRTISRLSHMLAPNAYCPNRPMSTHARMCVSRARSKCSLLTSKQPSHTQLLITCAVSRLTFLLRTKVSLPRRHQNTATVSNIVLPLIRDSTSIVQSPLPVGSTCDRISHAQISFYICTYILRRARPCAAMNALTWCPPGAVRLMDLDTCDAESDASIPERGHKECTPFSDDEYEDGEYARERDTTERHQRHCALCEVEDASEDCANEHVQHITNMEAQQFGRIPDIRLFQEMADTYNTDIVAPNAQRGYSVERWTRLGVKQHFDKCKIVPRRRAAEVLKRAANIMGLTYKHTRVRDVRSGTVSVDLKHAAAYFNQARNYMQFLKDYRSIAGVDAHGQVEGKTGTSKKTGQSATPGDFKHSLLYHFSTARLAS
jgi:hypothetical protein